MSNSPWATSHVVRVPSLCAWTLLAAVHLGCGRAEDVVAEPPCDQVKWGFELNKTDGGDWIAGPTLKPGGELVLTVSGLWRPPTGQGVSGVCKSSVTNVTWESSDSAIVRIGSASALSAVIVGGQVGTADVTAEFLVKGRPQTTYLRLTVAGSADHLSLVTHAPR